jgi:hypothetical protein
VGVDSSSGWRTWSGIGTWVCVVAMLLTMPCILERCCWWRRRWYAPEINNAVGIKLPCSSKQPTEPIPRCTGRSQGQIDGGGAPGFMLCAIRGSIKYNNCVALTCSSTTLRSLRQVLAEDRQCTGIFANHAVTATDLLHNSLSATRNLSPLDFHPPGHLHHHHLTHTQPVPDPRLVAQSHSLLPLFA